MVKQIVKQLSIFDALEALEAGPKEELKIVNPIPVFLEPKKEPKHSDWLLLENIRFLDKKPIQDQVKVISQNLDLFSLNRNCELVFEDLYNQDGFYSLLQIYKEENLFYKVIDFRLGNIRCYFNLASQIIEKKSFTTFGDCFFYAQDYIRYRLGHFLEMCSISKAEKESIKMFFRYLEKSKVIKSLLDESEKRRVG